MEGGKNSSRHSPDIFANPATKRGNVVFRSAFDDRNSSGKRFSGLAPWRRGSGRGHYPTCPLWGVATVSRSDISGDSSIAATTRRPTTGHRRLDGLLVDAVVVLPEDEPADLGVELGGRQGRRGRRFAVIPGGM